MKSVFLAAAVLAGLAQAQSFEVASVRPLGVNDHGPLIYSCTNGRFLNRGPLRLILQWIYGVRPYQLIGMPDWDPVVMYDNKGLYYIEARAAEPVSEDTCKQMTLTLLKDRFKLKVHTEDRDSAVFALVVAKGGLKAPKAVDGDGLSNHIVMNGRPMISLASGPVPGWSMDRLVELMGQVDGKPVINRTRLEGEYRISLNFSMSLNNPNLPPEAGPELPVALEQQMGLKLEPARAPVRYVLIDHIEKADPN